MLKIIEDKKDGLLFEAGDTESMSQAIITLIENQESRHSCAKNLRAKVQDRFSLEQMSENTLAVYKEVLGMKNILKLMNLALSIFLPDYPPTLHFVEHFW